MNDKYVDFADAERVVDESGKVVMTDATIGVKVCKWNCSFADGLTEIIEAADSIEAGAIMMAHHPVYDGAVMFVNKVL